MTRRLFGTLCGLVLLVNFGRVAFAPLVEPLRAAFDASPAAVGAVVSLAWFGTALVRVPTGYVLTRVPRHRVVLGTGGLLAAGSVLAALAPSLAALRVAAVVVGASSGAYFVSAVPLVGELYPEGVGRAVGIHGTAAQVAAVVAPGVVVGTLAVADWRATFWLLAVAAVGVTATLALVARRTAIPDPPADRDFRAALSHWRVVAAAVALIAGAGFVWQGVFNFYVSYLTAEKGLSLGTANLALTATFAAGIPAFAVSGRLADRLPHVPYLLGLLAAFVVCLFALTAVGGTAAVLVVSVALGYVVHGLFPALDAYVLAALPAGDRASTYAVFSGVALSLEAGGSGAVGFLVDAGYAFGTIFAGAAGLLALSVLALGALYVDGRFPGPAAEGVA
ncbi:MAG: MFS transporter [Haloferacaceae archaeon]